MAATDGTVTTPTHATVDPAAGFAQPGYWVWCGSPIRGDDGRYHLFASRWPRSLPFRVHWMTSSEIVHAVADVPEGPYRLAGVSLPPRGAGFWDGRMTHNPSIHRLHGRYVLFYTGTTYSGPPPQPRDAMTLEHPLVCEARGNQRVGVATSESLDGPWVRCDEPVVVPRPGSWDGHMTSNPAACELTDGRVLLVYKSQAQRRQPQKLGLAIADTPQGPYRRVGDAPIFDFPTPQHVEDPCVWRDARGGYRMLMKDMNGGLGGEPRAGILATSPDGLHWSLAAPARAYSRLIHWRDGTRERAPFLERPQVLCHDGWPTHLFLAMGRTGAADDEPHHPITDARNIVVPIGREVWR